MHADKNSTIPRIYAIYSNDRLLIKHTSPSSQLSNTIKHLTNMTLRGISILVL